MAVRTAFLTNFIPPYRLKLLTALKEKVGEFKIFVSTEMESDRPWIPEYGVLDVVRQKTKTFFRTRRHPSGGEQRLYIHFPYDTLRQLGRYNPEMVVSGELGLRSLQAALYRLSHPSSRLIIWATLSEQTERGWGLARQLLRRFILSVADGVVCNGSSGARYIASFGFPENRIFVVNQPIDVDLFAGLPVWRPEEKARRLLFSGRLIPVKAVLELQAACCRWALANPDRALELIWLGDGELRSQLEATEVPANFSQVFCGNKPYDALPEVYGQAGVLVLPSLLDEWGLVVNEAMVGGLVVIGSIYSQAATELVADGETGWLVDPLRPETIEQALDRLFATSPAALDRMRAIARDRGLMITPDKAAAKLAAAIEIVTAPIAEKKRGGLTLSGVGEPATSTDSLA